jgi:RHS repeat-associated protein
MAAGRAGGFGDSPRTGGTAAQRLGAAFAVAATLMGALGPLAPPASAGSPNGSPPSESTPVAPDAQVVEVNPSPIRLPEGGAGSGSTYTVPGRGIELRPTIKPPAKPTARTEIPGKRTEHSRVFANANGTYTQEISQGRLNYQDPSGTWQPLDLSLIADQSGPYDLKVRASDATVRFSGANGEVALAQMSDGNYKAGIRAIGYGAASARTGGALSFAGSGSAGTVGVLPTDTGFEFNVTIAGSDAATAYSFALDTGGLTAQLDSDGATVLLVDPVGDTSGGLPAPKVVGRVGAPVLIEGIGDVGDTTHVSVQVIGPGTANIPSDVSASVVAGLGKSEVLLTYRIDPTWLHDKARQFPIVLDPSVCIRKGSGCNASGAFDIWITQGHPTQWVDSTTTNYDHVGYYVATSGTGNAMTRGIFYFPDMTLPDEGAMVTSATLTLREFFNYSGTTSQNIYAQLMTKSWLVDSSQATWNNLSGAVNTTYNSPNVHPCNAGGTDCDVNFDVGKMVRAWYTRRPQDWKANVGIQVRYDATAESNNKEEVSFYNGNTTTAGNKPVLTINYVVPAVGIDFAPELGNTYAPSAMDAGKITKLPIIIRNNSSVTFNTATDSAGFVYKAAYRWFDDEGKAMACPTGGGDCTQALAGPISAGGNSGTFALNVQAPSAVGAYTLRIELAHVHVSDSKIDYASDWATPSKYFSRNKKILTSDNTRWVGSSAIERDEFGITVSAGGGDNSGELKSVALSDGNTLALNLGSANLHYKGGKAVGFDDLVDLGLSYGYDTANVADCTGVLAACGWYTNWDERIVPLGDYNYQYQGPSGNRYLESIDGVGQMGGGAPVLLERTRYTLFDESNLSGWTGTAPVVSTTYAYSGTRSLQIGGAGTGTDATYPSSINITHNQLLSLWVKSTGADKAVLGIKVLDADNNDAASWFYYTFSGTSFGVGSDYKWINTGTSLTSTGGYFLNAQNLFVDARAAIPTLSKNLKFETIDLRGATGGSNFLYYDALTVRAPRSTFIDDAHPAWTANAQSGLSTDKVSGTSSLVITSAPLSSSPDCVGCRNTDLLQYSWMDWYWKKAGGNSIAFVYYFKDARDATKTGTITYFAGPAAPAGAVNPVQVSPTLPTTWSRVHRNLLEDARQILNFYNDHPLGASPSAPPAPPAPDGVTLTGYKLSGVDGTQALFDAVRHTMVPNPGSSSVTDDDFVASYPDRSQHFFNGDGLLERIVDKDGNAINLDWTWDPTKSGPLAYTLTTIHAATDGSPAPGGTTYRRYLEVATTDPDPNGLRKVSFIERLGTIAAPINGRHSDFYVSKTASTGSSTYGVGDLERVSPIQNPGATCVPSPRPTGCDDFSYDTTTNHLLKEVRDPRWDGSTSGTVDYRWTVNYSGATPFRVWDNSDNAAAMMVASYDTGSSTVYARALWQDAAALAANTAQYVDLSPEGTIRASYAQKPCTGTCTFGSSATYPTAPASADLAASTTLDGLARVTSALVYRTAGTAVTATRSMSMAAAKVDNYADPLAAGEVAWSQSNDQFLASLEDTGGINPDLYRTEYAYDADHQLIDSVTPAYNATPNYAGVINSKSAQRKGYWRLDDASGNALDQAGTYPLTVSATGVARSQPGGLINDANTAMSFTAANSGRLSTTSLSVSQSAYSMAAWLKVTTANQKNVGVIGDFNSNSGAMINLDVNGYIEIAHGSTRVISTVIPTVGRWYQIVATWSATTGDLLLYIDGEVAAQGRTTTAPGVGATTFEIAAWGNGTSGTFVNAGIDEAAYYDVAITPVWVSDQYQAGRSFALADSQTIWDGEGHAIQQATSFLVNGGFESGLQGWGENQGADPHVLATPDSTVYSGYGSLQIDGTDFIKQPFQLVPGQTFRFQVAHRTDGGASTRASLIVEYWRPSTASWVALLNTSYSSSSWATHAWDFTLPMDSNGVVQVVPFNGAFTGTAWFDDALVVTDWQQQTPAANGVLVDAYGFGGAAGTVRTHHQQDPTADHPGIFDTILTANFHDVPGTAPDSDVATTSTVDAWGRTTRTTDADAFTVSAQSFAPNNVDAASATNSSGRTTSFTYDVVGNPLTSTDPAGVSSFAYDLRNHVTTTTGPDGIKSVDAYNGYGQRTNTTANWIDGSPSGASGTDDVATMFAYDANGQITTTIADVGTGMLGAKSTATFDLLGNTITSTTYADSAYTQARTTTNRFETYQPTSGPYAGLLVSRGQASGVQLPVSPAGSPAPLCPDGSGVRCNSVSTLDLGGRTVSTTDAYGIVTRTFSDLAGRRVRVVANETTAANDGLNDQNITTDTSYDTRGNPVTLLMPLTTSTWRKDTKAYDALSRLVSLVHKDANGATITTEATTYWKSGRVRTTNDGSATTETRYDALGRAFATIANADPSNNAGMAIDAFEGAQPAAWQSAGSGFFTTIASDASAFGLDAAVAGNEYTLVPPVSGRGRLHVKTSATAGSGTWRDFSGATYQAGHTYKASFDLLASAGSLDLTASFGQDQSGGSYGQLLHLSPTTWTRYSITWTPSASFNAAVHFAVTKPASGTADFYLDNVVVWDSTIDGQGKDWSQSGIVSSLTGYDADARVNATVLPPGDPGADRPLVTTTAPDPAGRTTMTVVNDVSGSYAAAVEGTANLVGYFPLDETTGSAAADQRPSPGTSLTGWTKPMWGLAGALDEARTAARFTGANGFLSRSSAVTGATTNAAMEAWVRADTTPTDGNSHVVAWNGSAANGWGLAIDSTGKASGFVAAAGSSTTMQSSVVVVDGAWHHVVLTRDTTTWTLYVDGASASVTGNTSSPGTPGAGFSIGALPDASRPFVGDVDDVSVSAANMVAATVTAHYAAGRRPAGDATTALASRTNYDELGRAVDSWSPALATLAGGATVPIRTHAVLDRLGHQLETWLNYQVGAATTPTGDTNVKSTFAYDVLGELIGYCPAVQVQGTGGCDVTSGTEPKAWHYAFDALGRQTKTIPPVNTTAAAQVTSETVYETGGRVGQTCSYPAATSCTATSGRHVDFTYDSLGRVITRKTWDKSTGTDLLKFTKNLVWNADGSQASVAEGATTLNYTYDTFGRPSQFKNGSTQLTAWTYTPSTSTVATRTDGPAGTGNTTSFGYDWARRTTSITATAGTFSSTGTVNRTYRLDGALATQAFPSSIIETLSYDAVKRPIGIGLGSAGSISQTFDRGARVTSEGRTLNGSGDAWVGTQSFFYDNLSRLGASSGPSTNSRAYQYDLDGNRASRTNNGVTTTFTYDRTDEAINQNGSPLFTYDRFGNVTRAPDVSGATSSYGFDEANRLTGITPPTGGAVSITIDPLDRHASRLVGGLTTDTYGYLGPTQTAWQTGNATTTSTLLDNDGSRLAIKTGSGSVAWLIFDLHGSVIGLCTAGTSMMSDAYRYDGYGERMAASGVSLNPWQYRGLLNIGSDSLTWALLDMGARDYAPHLGMFTQWDAVQGSAANPLSMNRYLYALANPSTLVDPDGHQALECDDVHGCNYQTNGPKPPSAPHRPGPRRPQPSTRNAAYTACSASKLNCTVADFRKMTLAQRVSYLEGFQGSYDKLGWLSGLTAFVKSARDANVSTADWFGTVDARVIYNIQAGYAAYARNQQGDSAGVQAWQKFWGFVGGQPPTSKDYSDIANQLVATAEYKSVAEGRFDADAARIAPNKGEVSAYMAADVFRGLQENRGTVRWLLDSVCNVPFVCDAARNQGVDVSHLIVDNMIDERNTSTPYLVGYTMFQQRHSDWYPPVDWWYGAWPVFYP